MSWIGFAFLTAFFESGKDVFGKKSLERSDEYVVAGAWRVFALPFLLPLLLVIKIPPLGAGFWWALLVSGGINVVTAILYMWDLPEPDGGDKPPPGTSFHRHKAHQHSSVRGVRESGVRKRLAGYAVMLVGVLLILWS